MDRIRYKDLLEPKRFYAIPTYLSFTDFKKNYENDFKAFYQRYRNDDNIINQKIEYGYLIAQLNYYLAITNANKDFLCKEIEPDEKLLLIYKEKHIDNIEEIRKSITLITSFLVNRSNYLELHTDNKKHFFEFFQELEFTTEKKPNNPKWYNLIPIFISKEGFSKYISDYKGATSISEAIIRDYDLDLEIKSIRPYIQNTALNEGNDYSTNLYKESQLIKIVEFVKHYNLKIENEIILTKIKKYNIDY